MTAREILKAFLESSHKCLKVPGWAQWYSNFTICKGTLMYKNCTCRILNVFLVEWFEVMPHFKGWINNHVSNLLIHSFNTVKGAQSIGCSLAFVRNHLMNSFLCGFKSPIVHCAYVHKFTFEKNVLI